MELNKYQREASKFARYGRVELYPFMALAEEAGEVMGKLAKYARKQGELPFLGDMTPQAEQLRHDLKKELGDVQWQLSQCAAELGMSLEEIAQANLAKLDDRAARDVLVGEGDDR